MSSPAAIASFRSAPSTAAHPKVLFVCPGDGQGSSMIFVRRQAESIASEGLEVDIFHLTSRTSPWRIVDEFRRFRSELGRLRPDVVHAHFGTVTALFCALACGGLPLVITFRGSDLNPSPSTYQWRSKLRAAFGRLFSQMAALRAKRIVCVSRQLRKRLWWRRDHVVVLPTGVDPDVFSPSPLLIARRTLGWPEGVPIVLFNAGRDPQVKRLALAKAVVEEARLVLPELRFEVLDGSVPPERLPDMMNAADCLLVTSASEGSPTVVQEALASNLPIVSVAVGDVAERVQGIRHTTLAPADASVLARAIVNIVSPARRSNGRSMIAEFSSVNVARKLKEIYGELA